MELEATIEINGKEIDVTYTYTPAVSSRYDEEGEPSEVRIIEVGFQGEDAYESVNIESVENVLLYIEDLKQ